MHLTHALALCRSLSRRPRSGSRGRRRSLSRGRSRQGLIIDGETRDLFLFGLKCALFHSNRMLYSRMLDRGGQA